MAQTFKAAKLSPVAHQALLDLQKGLHRAGLPEDVKLEDILSALVLYTTPPQAAGMLAEYWRYTALLKVEEEKQQLGPEIG